MQGSLRLEEETAKLPNSACLGKRCSDDDSEIATTFINSAKDEVDALKYVIVDIDDYAAPNAPGENILQALSELSDPILHLAFVQTIGNSDGAIPYLEYQIVTDAPISNDRSFISATGYSVSKGETYFWNKEGSWSQLAESAVNFVFQN